MREVTIVKRLLFLLCFVPGLAGGVSGRIERAACG